MDPVFVEVEQFDDPWLRSMVATSIFVPRFVRKNLEGSRTFRAEWQVNRTAIRLDVKRNDAKRNDAKRQRRNIDNELVRIASAVVAAFPYRPSGVHIVFVPCKETRRLPRGAGEAVGPEHVNGGLTASGRILVYRLEDAGKVLVHELVHLYGMDAALRDSNADAVEAALARKYGVLIDPHGAGGLGLNECYTDLLACWLYARWCNTDLVLVRRRMDAVAVRLLLHRPSKRTPERTHAFSYYVCKAALWHRLCATGSKFPETSLLWAPAQDIRLFATLVDSALSEWTPGDGSYGRILYDVDRVSVPNTLSEFVREVTSSDSLKMT
jgi:hypothetical protein